ncbi:MAG: tRNA pseudouridine(38-40) synthase TruA [Sphaerochaetaceae bacterium]|nr:tRNA pseudouridine(38-40) synthase TruA [Sphaerochaetaceae bacterium]
MARCDWKRPENFDASEGRRRIGILVSYDGRAFCGWQSQDGVTTVQQTIVEAVRKLTGQSDVEVCGSGRTDSGVHAWGQVAHIEIDDCTIPAKAFCQGLNVILPVYVRIRDSWDAGRSFHARYSAMAREYRYFMKEGRGKDCFSDGLIADIGNFPSFELLNGYAACIVGTHDFTSFASSKDVCPSKVRDIYESEFFMTTSVYGEDVLCYRICGNAFLYHMVRSLVGTMVQMGQKGLPESDFRCVLEKKDRSLCGKTASAGGLYLWRVSYDAEEYMWFEEKYGNTH